MTYTGKIKRAFIHFLDLIYPPLCCSCKDLLLHKEVIICTQCKLDLPVLDNPVVMQRIRDRLMDINPRFLSCYLYYKKGNITQKLLHQFKYQGNEQLGLILGRWLGEHLASEVDTSQVDLIVPVPLHRSKLKKRGFNQSAVIAKAISEMTNLPCRKNAIARLSTNKSQTKKTRLNRMMDVRDIFEVHDPEILKGKHVLLVDDVITTGSTIASCATKILEAGADKVSLASLAAAQ